MAHVLVTGWQPHIRKVETTKTIREHLGLGLSEAKGLTNAILDGHRVRLEVATLETGHTLASALRDVGVDTEVVAE